MCKPCSEYIGPLDHDAQGSWLESFLDAIETYSSNTDNIIRNAQILNQEVFESLNNILKLIISKLLHPTEG